MAPFLAGINSDGIGNVVGCAGRGGGLESVVEKVRVGVIANGERLEGFWPQILVLFLSWPE